MGQTMCMTADTAANRKARGAVFTPPEVARYIVNWAVRTPSDAVFEPSCGEAIFLLEAGDKMDSFGTGPRELGTGPGELAGVELHPESAEAARTYLRERGHPASIQTGDFFATDPVARYDAVVGNPPYIRYQDFSGSSRSIARQAALRAGVPLSQLASSWAAFVVHACLFLRPGGRIGLVVPAEIMVVNYAAPVREFLMKGFSDVTMVHFVERVFDVQEEVVLLLADGYQATPNGTDHFKLMEAQGIASLREELKSRQWAPITPSARWIDSLVDTSALSDYQALADSQAFTTLGEWGSTTLGMVTGNNKFFALTDARVRELKLDKRTDLERLSPPGSSHLRGLALTIEALDTLAKNDRPTWLFRPSSEPTPAAQAYIRSGEAAGVSNAYKCRVRKPWWRVPKPVQKRPADLFLTYMNADTVRLCSNRAKVWALNSVHGVYLDDDLRDLRDLLTVAALNSVTMLGAEISGRAYGGGMLKMEPREADKWVIPSPGLISQKSDELLALRPQLSSLLRGGKLAEAAGLVDAVLLTRGGGVDPAMLERIRGARRHMLGRREARGTRAQP